MSSISIAIKTITKSGKQYIAELNSGETEIDLEDRDGTFRIQPEEIEGFEELSGLFNKVYDWFFERLGDAECGHDELDDALSIYGSGNAGQIIALKKEEVSFVSVFSRAEFWDEPFGASLIAYDYMNKAFFEEHRDEIPYSDMEDCYGENLYEQFLSKEFTSICANS
nr:hypothetical protein [Clostridia bacterium]